MLSTSGRGKSEECEFGDEGWDDDVKEWRILDMRRLCRLSGVFRLASGSASPLAPSTTIRGGGGGGADDCSIVGLALGHERFPAPQWFLRLQRILNLAFFLFRLLWHV